MTEDKENAQDRVTAEGLEETPNGGARSPHGRVYGRAMSDSPYMTLAEAEDYSRYSSRQLRRWIADSKLTRCGHGRKILVRRDELEALISGRPDSDRKG